MKVTIKERDYDFVPDYPHEWQQSPGGFFKCPVLIGAHKCFVKRFFNKSPQDIPGWNLLVRLKYKNENNLPRLYDIMTTEEKHVETHYVFYEYIKGTSLDIRLESDMTIDLERLTNDLFSAFKSLNKYEHWFADFSEENIFCEDSDRFLLFNLDSALSASETAEMSGNNVYASLVSRFFTEVLNKDIDLTEMPGIALNYLQLIFLILRIKISQQEQQMDYSSPQLVPRLPEYLDNIDPGFRSLFTRLAGNREVSALSYNDNEIREMIIRLIVNAPISLPDIVAVPEIVSFQASTEKIGKGETFTLDWQVNNATGVEVFKNGAAIRKFPADQTSMAINEFYDGRDKEITYTLVASNDTGVAESLPVTIRVAESQPAAGNEPDIVYFRSTSSSVKDGEIFTLQWQASNSTFVELFKNGRSFQKFGPDTNTLALSESASQGKKRDIEYTLDAGNAAGKITSESLRIKVEPGQAEVRPIGWVPNKKIIRYILGLAAAVAIIAFVVFRYFESKPKINYFLPESIAEEHTLIIRGSNFPADSNKFQVLFNNVKGDIQYNTDDLIRVGVPFLGENLNGGNVRVAVVIDDDTTYASKSLKVNRLPRPGAFTSEVKDLANSADSPVVADLRSKPKPVPKKKVTVDTAKSVVFEHEPEIEEPKPVIDLRSMVKVTGVDFRKKTLGGIKDLAVTVKNDSPFDLDQVQVEISYLKNNEKELKKETVAFTDIRAHTSKTMSMPESNRGKKVNYKIISINSKQFDQQ